MKKLFVIAFMFMLSAFMLSGCATIEEQSYGGKVIDTDVCCIAKVSENIIIMENVMFDWDKSFIREDQQPIINSVAELMSKHPDILLVLKGYASTEGAEDYNLELSTARVNSVKNALIEKGVDPNKITNSIGKGETDEFGIDLFQNRKVIILSVQ